jgi:hypothetical protein
MQSSQLNYSSKRISDNNSQHPDPNTSEKVGQSKHQGTVLNEPQRFEGKRRKSCIGAAKTGGKNQSVIAMNEGAILRKRHKKTENDGPACVLIIKVPYGNAAPNLCVAQLASK